MLAISALPSMPILIAATAKSSRTASICAPTIPVGGVWTVRTPRVFWAVSAVMTQAP
jgi:hypothetical protein